MGRRLWIEDLALYRERSGIDFAGVEMIVSNPKQVSVDSDLLVDLILLGHNVNICSSQLSLISGVCREYQGSDSFPEHLKAYVESQLQIFLSALSNPDRNSLNSSGRTAFVEQLAEFLRSYGKFLHGVESELANTVTSLLYPAIENNNLNAITLFQALVEFSQDDDLLEYCIISSLDRFRFNQKAKAFSSPLVGRLSEGNLSTVVSWMFETPRAPLAEEVLHDLISAIYRLGESAWIERIIIYERRAEIFSASTQQFIERLENTTPPSVNESFVAAIRSSPYNQELRSDWLAFKRSSEIIGVAGISGFQKSPLPNFVFQQLQFESRHLLTIGGVIEGLMLTPRHFMQVAPILNRICPIISWQIPAPPGGWGQPQLTRFFDEEFMQSNCLAGIISIDMHKFLQLSREYLLLILKTLSGTDVKQVFLHDLVVANWDSELYKLYPDSPRFVSKRS